LGNGKFRIGGDCQPMVAQDHELMASPGIGAVERKFP
jgi:hypothetical protein